MPFDFVLTFKLGIVITLETDSSSSSNSYWAGYRQGESVFISGVLGLSGTTLLESACANTEKKGLILSIGNLNNKGLCFSGDLLGDLC
jgi:hypothetical protein